MALGYPTTHVFELAFYAQHHSSAGRVCHDPARYYGDDWRDSDDLEVHKGTEDELVEWSLTAMNKPTCGMHDFRIAREILKYISIEVVKSEGKYVRADSIPESDDE